MKYVKLIARKDTWFKEGTEVYQYDPPYEDKKRFTLDEWNQCVKDGMICARGIRVCEEGYEVDSMKCEIGEEREDGECCHIDEFDAIEIDESN